jgi:hypothetical protein
MSTYSASHRVNGSGATVGILYPGYHGPPVMAHKSGYDRFCPMANGWGTLHPVPDVAPPLLAEEEGPMT